MPGPVNSPFPAELVTTVARFLAHLKGAERDAAAAALAQWGSQWFSGTGELNPEIGAPFQLRSEKGEPDGYAGLDGDGFVPDDQIAPEIARDAEVILRALLLAAGDLIVASAPSTPARLAVGADYAVLTIDPVTHLPAWVAPIGGPSIVRYEPLTNGNPAAPELIFDSTGDCIMVPVP